MEEGYIYILSNDSLNGLLKIGSTTRVYFEYTRYEYIGGYLKNQSIYRIDLGFIIEDIDEDDKVFKKEVPIEVNVKNFPDFFAYVSLGQTVYKGRDLAMD